jgi:hypothetical protein
MKLDTSKVYYTVTVTLIDKYGETKHTHWRFRTYDEAFQFSHTIRKAEYVEGVKCSGHMDGQLSQECFDL